LWSIDYYKVPVDRRICFLYLCNDVMQTSRRHTPVFIERFITVLPKAISTLLRESDEMTRAKVNRLLRIWKDRQVLPVSALVQISSLPLVDIGPIDQEAPPSPAPPKATKPPPLEEVSTKKAPSTVIANNGTGSGTSESTKPIPVCLERPVTLLQELFAEEVPNLDSEEILLESSKDTIFPWEPQSKARLTSHNALEKLTDVQKTYTAALDMKKRIETDLERRAELVTLLTQLKDKQEALLQSNINRLEDCLGFLENIKAAKSDLEEFTGLGKRRYNDYSTDDGYPKRPTLTTPPPPLMEPPSHSMMNNNYSGAISATPNSYLHGISAPYYPPTQANSGATNPYTSMFASLGNAYPTYPQ